MTALPQLSPASLTIFFVFLLLYLFHKLWCFTLNSWLFSLQLLHSSKFIDQSPGSNYQLSTCQWGPNGYLWPRALTLWALDSHTQLSYDFIPLELSHIPQTQHIQNISQSPSQSCPSSCSIQHYSWHHSWSSRLETWNSIFSSVNAC